MKKYLLQLLACFSVALPIWAQNPAASCAVTVSTTQPGGNVGREGKVKGKARIPNNTYLWVLSHMKDYTADWWPQGRHPASIDPKTGEWVIISAYGKTEDIKEDFEVAVVVVDPNTDSLLRNWFKDAEAKHYPPIDFPTPIDGCPPIKIIVHKVSH